MPAPDSSRRNHPIQKAPLYQVIVEEDVEPEFPDSFAKPVFSVYLPADATSVTIPEEFMQEDTDYEYEVLAIEESGNQTLSSAAFATAEAL